MRLLLAGGGLLIISAVLQVLARKTGWFGQWYAQWVYPWLSGTLARFFGLFPFPVGELLLYLSPAFYTAFVIWGSGKR